jgi:hypothetical protein
LITTALSGKTKACHIHHIAPSRVTRRPLLAAAVPHNTNATALSYARPNSWQSYVQDLHQNSPRCRTQSMDGRINGPSPSMQMCEQYLKLLITFSFPIQQHSSLYGRLGSTSCYSVVTRGSFRGVHRPRREADHSQLYLYL